MDPIPHECGLAAAAQLFLVCGPTMVALFAAIGGLSATQLATPALRAARILGGLSILGGALIAWWTWAMGADVWLLWIPALPIVFGGLVFAAVRKMSREEPPGSQP